jgi:hypothetical protein
MPPPWVARGLPAALTLLVAAIAGCSDSHSGLSEITAPTLRQETVPQAARPHLPVGTKVPVGTVIYAPPEPFDARRHRAIANSRSDRNLVRRADFHPPPRFKKGTTSEGSTALSPAGPPPGTGDRGLSFFPWSYEWYGVHAVHDAGLSIVLEERPATAVTGYIYAPTLLPSGNTCIEATTIHQRGPGPSATTLHRQGWYDWCESGPEGDWLVLEDMDQEFQDHYVRVYLGAPTLAISIVTPNDGITSGSCWFGHLYDYLAGGWVQVTTSCATGAGYSPGAIQGRGGWSYWESWFLLSDGYCPSIPNLRALDIMFAHPQTGSWVPISSTPAGNVNVSGGQACWDVFGGPYTFTYPGTAAGLPANAWFADTEPWCPRCF